MTNEAKTLHERLVEIQQTLKAPKGQYNDFSKFYYRSCEDILEAVKPLLKGLSLRLSDEVVNIGQFNYVKATVELNDGSIFITASAFAREAIDRKGMDDAQITGSASSYARKYALNGLFAIDDTKDADTQDNTKIKTITITHPIGEMKAKVKTTFGSTKSECNCHAPAGKPHGKQCPLYSDPNRGLASKNFPED